MKNLLMMILLCACGDDAPGIVNPDACGACSDGTAAPDACSSCPDAALEDGRTDDSLTPQPSVPGGMFLRSYDGLTYTNTSYPATVSGFTLDKYEVTVARFRVFVAATSLPTAPLACATSAMFPATWTATAGANEMKPINCITWTEADAFCRWDGGRLPTEAEWNYAASGGSEQREYPWGSTLDETHASYNSITAVGSKPAGDGRWGQSDLAGNVSEWVLDWYADPYTNPCVDCTNTTPSATRSRRGGGVTAGPTSPLLAAARQSAAPSFRGVSIGVRCAR